VLSNVLDTDVIIVGAGPTGLMAANQLMRFGINFIILDKKSGPTKESRALLVTARSLEIYQQMGVVNQVIAGGKLVTSFNIFSDGKRIVELVLGEMGKGLSQFSHMLAFEQSKNEALLVNNLQENGHAVHWNYEFVEVKVYEDRLDVTVNHAEEELHFNAKYLIACDGANSTVRNQLNFAFKGGTYVHRFFLADTIIDWSHGYDKIILTPGSETLCAFFPLYGDGNVRMIGTLPKSYTDKEDITFEDLKENILKTSKLKIEFKSVNWFSVYKLHHRAVDHFREGRIFLAGDSAHIHSPAGGQGMNTGLQDAYNLSWKLALVLKGYAKSSLLDTYNEERLPFARWLLRFTDRGFTLMPSSNWFIRLIRRYVALPIAGLVMSQAKIKYFGFTIVSQIWYNYRGKSLTASSTRQRLKFKSGDRLPYLENGNIYPKFTRACFHLLHIGDNVVSENKRNELAYRFPFEVVIVEDVLDERWQRLGVEEELFVLVRPDNYISMLADGLDIDKLSSSKYWVNPN